MHLSDLVAKKSDLMINLKVIELCTKILERDQDVYLDMVLPFFRMLLENSELGWKQKGIKKLGFILLEKGRFFSSDKELLNIIMSMKTIDSEIGHQWIKLYVDVVASKRKIDKSDIYFKMLK